MVTKLRRHQIIDGQLSATGNNFNLVRILLAASVIWTHCYWQVHRLQEVDTFSPYIGLPISHLAVNGFFFVSGFLILQSVLRQPDALHFGAMRVGRIWPGLAVCTVLTLLAFSAISGDAGWYFTRFETWRFLAGNLVQLHAEFFLPTTKTASGLWVVNGSLWTISWELRCYLVLGLLYLLPFRHRRCAAGLLVAASFLFCGAWVLGRNLSPVFPDYRGGVFYLIDIWARLWGSFAVGVAAGLYWKRIPIVPLALLPLWLLALAEFRFAGTALLASLATYYSVLVLAFGERNTGARGRALSAGWHDLSYGTYIYAFPLMFLLYHFWPTDSFALLALANLLLTLLVASFSWLLVEKPALRSIKQFMKQRPARRQARARPADADERS